MGEEMKYLIDKINKTVIFKFSSNKDLETRIKNCGYTARYNEYEKGWVVSVNDYTKPLILAIIKDFKLKAGVVPPIVYKKFDYGLEKDVFNNLSDKCKCKQFSLTPRPYQIEALGFGLKNGNIINGEDVGIGKSYESILYTEISNSFPCLVVVPASIKYSWGEKWASIVGEHRSVSVIESKDKVKNWDADVVVINYDIIARKQGKGVKTRFEELVEKPWKMVIFDEAHFLKNEKSQRSKAAKKIVKKNPKIQLLSGTITMSKPIELWNLLKIAKVDHFVASSWITFIKKYCGAYQGRNGWDTSGATNTIELNNVLRETCYIRREKREVIKDLPPVIKQVIKVDVTNKKELHKATYDFINYMEETYGEDAAERAMEAEHLVSLGVLRRLSVQGKVKAVERYLNEWKESGRKLLIFGVHREVLEHLSKKYNSKLIAGGVSAKKKQKIVDDFQKSDDLFLFANMISAGTGVDGLQNVCSDELIIELPWRPSDLEQVVGRIDRLGQKEPTSITFMLCFETIDKHMWEMLEEKEIVTEAVNKGIDLEKSESGMKMVLRKMLKSVN